jgi:hypothetical protein
MPQPGRLVLKCYVTLILSSSDLMEFIYYIKGKKENGVASGSFSPPVPSDNCQSHRL